MVILDHFSPVIIDRNVRRNEVEFIDVCGAWGYFDGSSKGNARLGGLGVQYSKMKPDGQYSMH